LFFILDLVWRLRLLRKPIPRKQITTARGFALTIEQKIYKLFGVFLLMLGVDESSRHWAHTSTGWRRGL